MIPPYTFMNIGYKYDETIHDNSIKNDYIIYVSEYWLQNVMKQYMIIHKK